MKVIILRGLPGSGKSTHLKEMRIEANLDSHVITCSADTYFTNPVTKVYTHDPSKLSEAHSSCLLRFVEWLDRAAIEANSPSSYKAPFILVVDNTNLTALEMAPYVALAIAYQAEIEMVSLVTPIMDAHHRNVHGAPREAYAAMDKRFWDFEMPHHWKTKVKHTVIVEGNSGLRAAELSRIYDSWSASHVETRFVSNPILKT